MVGEGQTVTLASVDAGQDLKSRLAAMGLLPKTPVTVVRNGGHGPFVVSVRDSRVVLGRGVADKIKVI